MNETLLDFAIRHFHQPHTRQSVDAAIGTATDEYIRDHFYPAPANSSAILHLV